jgi:hypothetical protein
LINDKLISGYYGGQKLPNGIPYSKPKNMGKCSHGGMFDKTADEISKGGINKDSGYFIVSPRANLHKQAADMAIRHTKYFFETIRNRIGDREYSNFLNLNLTASQLAAGRPFVICRALLGKQSINTFIFMNIFSSFFIISFIENF